MNANYGLFPPLDPSGEANADAPLHAPGQRRRSKLPKRERNVRLAARALAAIEGYVARVAPERS
jgi:hypothetical protein